MKALLYKEFKLAMHPMCYVFIFAFPLMTLIPAYPIAVGFIYILSAYPILFLGANKGQQSNDLLYSTLLPVRKRDIVLARIITVAIMQFTYIAIMCALYPVVMAIQVSALANDPNGGLPGLGINAFTSILAFAIIGFAVADLIFFPTYYKNGKSIVMSTLLTVLGFAVYLMLFTVIFPYIPVIGGNYVWTFSYSGIGWQLLFLGGALIVYFVLHIFVYKISYKRLEKVDF